VNVHSVRVCVCVCACNVMYDLHMLTLNKLKPMHINISSSIWRKYVCAVIGLSFYRVMRYSAKRGLAIACRLSVRL